MIKRRGIWIKYCIIVSLLIISPVGSALKNTSANSCNYNQDQFSYGVLDRLENDLAVILIEKTGQELLVPQRELPENSQENIWLKVTCKGVRYDFMIDEQKTENQREKAMELLKKLRRRK